MVKIIIVKIDDREINKIIKDKLRWPDEYFQTFQIQL